MRFERVKAHDFGPLHEQELVLAPGMTLVHGANEAGKSTWHAALYASLCGMRRAKGQPAREDREFRERHKPWASVRWRVTATVALEDGRCIELHHDLDGKVECRAVDLAMGRDCASDIMFEGAPDGSRWLGLDRRSFLATACVRQTELLQVKADASALQHHLQRAADTAGADHTAAAALERIDTFRTENVGQVRVGSNRPLPRAVRAVDDAHRELTSARTEHAQYLKMIAEADRLQQSAKGVQLRLNLFRAAVAHQAAQDALARLVRVRELHQLVPQGAPAPRSDDDACAQGARTALDGWQRRPTVPTLEGESAESLNAQLLEIPPMPTGETTPDPRVVRARESMIDADTRLADHAAAARVSDAPVPPRSLQAAPPSYSRLRLPILVGGITLLAGLAFIGFGLLPVGLGIIGAGVALAAILTIRTRSPAAMVPVPEPPRNPPVQTWQDRADHLDIARSAAMESLGEALQARGMSVVAIDRGTLDAAFDAYVIECDSRRGLAVVAGRRGDLEARLLDRERTQASAAGATDQIASARTALVESGHQCGIDSLTESGIVEELERWVAARSARLAEDEQYRRCWTELQTLLGDETLASLEAGFQEQQAEVERLTVGQSGAIDLEPDLNSQRTKLESAVQDARQAADNAAGMAQERQRVVPSVADAEEAVARANLDLEALRQLDAILEQTREFLSRAQDRVHRDIAPILAAGLDKWLPIVTEGRYAHAIVDPETLDVQVSANDGRLRYAHLLSHGTAEQAYLLLRAIMAHHLTKPGEVCPLLLDDVTAHCDSHRQRAVLEVLHEISSDRQVILFAQEDGVLEWGRAKLQAPRDRVIELGGPIPLTS